MSLTYALLPDNPCPEGGVWGVAQTQDELNIRFVRFRTMVRPHRGSVIVAQGRNESIEKYFETISDLLKQGFDCVSFDWRGQGASSRLVSDSRRGHVNDFADYGFDLEALLQQVVFPDMPPPYFLLAHSMGALATLTYGPNLNNRIERMVLSAPFLGVGSLPVNERVVRGIIAVFYNLGLGHMFASGNEKSGWDVPFEKNLVTSDPERYSRNQKLYQSAPELSLGGPTVTWLHESFRAMDKINRDEYREKMGVPCLFIVAGADKVVSPLAGQDYAQSLRIGHLLTIDGAEHELLQEADVYREPALAAAIAFMQVST